jgi:hypothetical protein
MQAAENPKLRARGERLRDALLEREVRRRCRLKRHFISGCESLSDRYNVLCWHRPPLSRAFGRLQQFAHGDNQLINCFRRERRFTIFRANPSVNVRHADRNAVLIVLECRRTPFFRSPVRTANWNRLVCHMLLLLSPPPGRRTYPPKIKNSTCPHSGHTYISRLS